MAKKSWNVWAEQEAKKRAGTVKTTQAAPTSSVTDTSTQNTTQKKSWSAWAAEENKRREKLPFVQKVRSAIDAGTVSPVSGRSLDGWLKDVDVLTKHAREYYSGWNGMTPDTDRDIRKIAQNYLALANDYRAEYAGDEKSLKAISAYAKGLNDLLKYAEPKHKDAQGISSAYGISDTELEKKLADKDNPIAFTTSEGEKISWRGVKEQKDLSQLYGLSSEDLEKEQAKSGSGVAYTTMDGQNITWNALLRSKKKEEQYADLSSRDDWDELSKYKSTIPSADADYNDPSLQAIDWAYELVNNPEFSSEISDTFKSKHLNEDERKVFNYLYHTESSEAAFAYYDTIEEDLNARHGVHRAKTIREIENPIGRVAATGAYGFAAGVDKFESGLRQAFTEELLPTTSLQFGSAYILEDLADTGPQIAGESLGQTMYKTVNQLGNQTPSILVSTAASFLNPALGKAIGSGLQGLSAGGNAYKEAVEAGYDKEGAKSYGRLIGASEAVLQSAIGGIGKLGGITDDVILSKVAAVDNVFKRFALTGAVKIGSEVFEEEVQEFLDPLFKSVIFDEEYDVPTIQELAQTAIVTALSTGILEGGSAFHSTFGRDAQLNNLYSNKAAAYQEAVQKHLNEGVSKKEAEKAARIEIKDRFTRDFMRQQLNETASAMASEGLEIDPENKKAKQIQQRLADGKNVSGYSIDLLAQQNEEGLIKSDKAKIKQAAFDRLTELGATEDVESVADALAKRAAGEKLTKAEQDLIKRNRFAPRVANELNPENIRTGALESDWSQKIDTDRINAQEYSRLVEEAQIAPETKETEGDTVLDPNENVAQVSSEVVAEESPALEIEHSAMLNIDDVIESVDFDSVNPISAIRNGRMVLRLADGRTVSSDSVTHASEDVSNVYSIAQKLAPDAKTANAMVNGYKPGMNASTYIKGMELIHLYGKLNSPMTELLKSGSAKKIPVAVRDLVYKAGQRAAGHEIAAEQAKINASKVMANPVQNSGITFNSGNGEVVSFDEYVKEHTFRMNDVQKSGIAAMRLMNSMLGSEYDLFESYINKDGRRVYINDKGKEVHAPNGFYDGKIHVDINAGRNGEGVILYTVAHESAHEIRRWSPAKFKTLANFVIEKYGEAGFSVEKLIARQMDKAARAGRELTYEEALEEVVADSMEGILKDGKVAEMVTELRKQDATLADKVVSWFKKLLNKFKATLSAYDNYTPDSVEGQLILSMEKNVIEQIQQLYAEGLVSAAEAKGTIPGVEGTAYNAEGDAVAHTTADGTMMLSLRTYEEDGRTAFRKYLEKCVKNDKLTKEEMQEMMDDLEGIYTICKEFKDQYAPFGTWSDAAVVRDTRGRPVFSVVTPNGDYKMNLDFSLVCKKRRTLDAVFNEMAKRGIIDDFELGQKSVVKINEMIRKHGFETACALCFVDAKRFRQAAMADSFTSLYNELVTSLVPEDQADRIDHYNFSGYENVKSIPDGIHTWDKSKLDFSHINHVMKTYGSGTVEYKAANYIKNHAEGRKLLLRGDFMSSEGFDAVKSQNTNILKLYNSKKGTGGPKAAFGDVQYMNEILKKARTWTPEKAYAVGGVRIQSFSDYVPRMVFDYTQMIYDLAATKLPAHAYTKEELFVKQFGLTGIKINMSLIPAIAEGGIAPGLDANGNYVWAGESFDFETAKEIQNAEGYTENCGTICVGVSYDHIVKLLGDDNIRMVIPYHKSGLNPVVAHMNKIAAFTDYTSMKTNPGGCQSTVHKDGSKVEKDFNFNKVLHETGDPKATIQQYLEWCAKNEYIPRFAEFAWHPNYYKLIEDFTLYDKDGKYVPQREVRAVFPKDGSPFGSMKDLIQAGLEEDAIVEGKRDKSLSEIVDEIERTLPKTEAEIAEEQVEQADRDLEADVKLSARDPNWKPNLDDTEWGIVKYTINNYQGTAITSNCNMFFKKSKGRTVFGIYSTDDSTLLYASRNRTAEKECVFVDLLREGYKNGDVADTSAEGLRTWAKTVRMQRIANDNHGSGNVASGRFGGNVGLHGKPSRLYSSAALRNVLENIFKEEGPAAVSGGLNQYDTVKESDHVSFSDRDGDSVSNRSLLANAFEGTVTNDIERGKITEYREKMSLMEAEEQKLHRLNAEIKELSFAKGPRDKARIEALRTEAQKTANRINVYDGQLLRLEASKPLQNVLEREKAKAYARAEKKGKAALKKQREGFEEKSKQMQKELSAKYREKKQELVEKHQDQIAALKEKHTEQRENERDRRNKTAMRGKIRKVIGELDKLLNHGNKKTNVKAGMREFVAGAVSSAEVLFKDEHTDVDMIRDGVGVTLSEEEQLQYDKAREILSKMDKLTESNANAVAEKTKLEGQLSYRLSKLKEALHRERIRINEAVVSDALGTLADEYEKLKDSEYAYVKGAFSESVYNYIKLLQRDIGGAKIKDMTLGQLEDLYKAYRMALTTVRDANKAFVASKSVDEIVENLVTEVEKRKMPKTKAAAIARNLSNKIGWDYEKLYYALQRIGSNTLTELFTNLANAEDIVLADVKEANAKKMEIVNKYKYNNWNVDQKINKIFTDTTGKRFQMTLGELMSLYAYSRRAGAWNHIEYGGFVFNKTALTDTDPVTTYKLTKEQCEAITNTLTEEQKHFVEEMQTFLSDTMGAKGNEVSMKLYGVEMFGEKNYFPVHVAGQFMARAQESQAKAAAGFSSMTNAGFTQAQNKKAKAPFIMESFMDVWADHVNEMSRYHGTVPALEDIRKVMNYSSYSDAYADSVSVQAILENKYGKEAVQYFNDLYQEANSGAITDKLQKPAQKWISKFRKNSVAYSASVLIQQPASIVRAYAMLPMKYFRGKGVLSIPAGAIQAVFDHSAYKTTYAEMLKYAPGVTLSKEIGGFDTASGNSIRTYLLDTGKNIKQKWKTETDPKGRFETVMDVIDDNPIANLPNVADKIAWIEIWNACKRETAAKNRDLKTNSDAFMKLVGERFTEVIRATQVYDSMFSKSPLLRNKNVFVQSLVSFMNEPNTTANMVENAIRTAARGDGKTAARTITAVAGSTVFTCVLKSLVYAMRDEDEDKKYIEKYMGELTDNLISDFTVFNYIPVARDIWSTAQGFDVERTDMAIISDIMSAIIERFTLAAKNTDEMTEDELIEFDKKVIKAHMSMLDSVCAAFGIPEKNIRREIKAILNVAKSMYKGSGGEASWASIEDAVLEGVKGASPSFMGPEIQSKGDKLYEAIISGDTAYADRLKSGYKDEKAVTSAIRKALGNNEPRILKAAELLVAQDYDEGLDLIDEIVDEGKFTWNDVVSAVNTKVNKLTEDESDEETAEKAKSTVSAKDYVNAVLSGSSEDIKAVHDDVIGTNVENGKAEEDAEKNLISGSKTELKKRYVSGEIDKAQVQKALTAIGAENVEQTVLEWTCEVVTGKSYDDHIADYKAGLTSASELSGKLTRYGGLSSDEAKKKIVDYSKDAYENGAFDRSKMIGVLVNYGGKDRSEAESVVQYMEYKKSHPDVYVNESWIDAYNKEIKSSGLNLDTYVEYREQVKSITGDGKKERRMAVIHSLPISNAQKDALYLSEGWTQSRLYEAPWH